MNRIAGSAFLGYLVLFSSTCLFLTGCETEKPIVAPADSSGADKGVTTAEAPAAKKGKATSGRQFKVPGNKGGIE